MLWIINVVQGVEPQRKTRCRRFFQFLYWSNDFLRLNYLLTGLLGLELHEKPSPWSETWLDALTVGQVSFGGADVKVANEVDEGWKGERWTDYLMLNSCFPWMEEQESRTWSLSFTGTQLTVDAQTGIGFHVSCPSKRVTHVGTLATRMSITYLLLPFGMWPTPG